MSGLAQPPVYKRGWLSTKSDTVYIDSLCLIPGSFRAKEIDSNAYQLYPLEGKLVWKIKPSIDSVFVEYKTFSFSLHQRYSHKKGNIIESNFFIKPYFY
ncbi:MAG: hypothetical protein FGM54_12370, partial [Chitinophagaceae bacterium]|nr:hypothetical protein [Chitinophagaceae bacterium]